MLNKKHSDYPLVCNIDNETYHELPGLSSSAITMLLKCPLNYYERYIEKSQAKKETKDMEIGTVVHTYLLEKDSFLDRFYPTENYKKNTKAYKEEVQRAGNRTIIPHHYYDACLKIKARINSDPEIKDILKGGKTEESYFWEDKDTGLLLKSRPDYVTENYIVDIKKTVSCAKSDFEKSLRKYKYPIQAAMQLDAFKEITGISHTYYIYIAIESKPPYLSKGLILADEAIEKGRAEYKKALEIYQECLANNHWPTNVEGLEQIGEEY